MNQYLHTIAEGETLSRDDAEEAMDHMMTGEAAPEETAGFLLGLRARGETLDELVGFTRSMRKHAVPVDCDDPHAIDLCGTGGDGSGTFNISTAAAFVCAGAGVTVAKHGNRSVSSKCGSADVLEALGVDVELRKEGVERCLREAGIAFIFAPFFHPAMRFVMPVRRQLGVRTCFNILGPLCNPAGVRRQLVGAFNLNVAQRMAGILANLDAEHVIAVHSDDGLDEISLAADTHAYEYTASNGSAASDPRGVRIRLDDHDVRPASLDALQGGTAATNADIIRRILEGAHGPPRDVVLLNAAYALRASGRFDTPEHGFEAAVESIDSGAALRSLRRLVDLSNATA